MVDGDLAGFWGFFNSLLVGLSAAIAMNCQPSTKYYLSLTKDAGIKKEEIKEVFAKVMAVAAGQKKLQAKEVFDKLQDFESQ